jgi:arginyl-tRNA synthetase
MEKLLREKIIEAITSVYGSLPDPNLIQLQETKKEYSGDFTFVVFPILRYSKTTPEQTADGIGKWLKANFSAVSSYNVIKGFLNLTIGPSWWFDYFSSIAEKEDIFEECRTSKPETVLVEYSSPNTNKPLHLGHIRNNLLGFSLYRILTANGHNVIKTNIVNDRGIHICKSMLAWQMFSGGETPESSGMKGDHLVGKYYVIFDKELKKQVEALVASGKDEETARNQAPLMIQAREMLLKWEQGDSEIVELWKKMNSWVYAGFDLTYKKLGVDFDKIYYESETYTKGKEISLEGLRNNFLYRNPDGSVWADLTSENLDQKLLLRSDGTAVYMTQDLGTAFIRHQEYNFDKTLYVVGNEQNYHFQVLRAILKKMGFSWADGLVHFSYGMVELPEGKMKSREGTVVDADDLIEEMKNTAREVSEELGKLSEFTDDEKEEIITRIGLGALKYYILKVDPRKNMMFNPADSIDFNGNTGPFIQYTAARIKSVLRKAASAKTDDVKNDSSDFILNEKEIELIKLLRRFPGVVKESAELFSPALIANYCYDLAREYNQFYHDNSILGDKNSNVIRFRLALSDYTCRILSGGMWLLGIDMPDRM